MGGDINYLLEFLRVSLLCRSRFLESLKRLRIPYGNRSLVGKHAQPYEVLVGKDVATENPENAEDLTAENERVAHKASNLFLFDPVGPSDPLLIQRNIRDEDRFSARTDYADLAMSLWNSLEASLNRRPVFGLVYGTAGAGG